MKILHMIASANVADGGPIEGVLRLGHVLSRRGHEQHVMTLDPPGPEELFPNTKSTIHALGRSPATGGGLVARLRRWMRWSPQAVRWAKVHVSDYDVVIINGLWNYSTWVARRALADGRTPYIVYSHGMLDPWFKRTYPLKHAVKQLLWLFNEGVLLRRADAVAFTAREEQRLAAQSFRPYSVRGRVVAYGTSDVPPETQEQAKAFRQTVPRLGDRPFLLFLSRIHEKKGCDILVEAFARVARDDLQLVIAGPDQSHLRPALQQKADALGIGDRLHWPGMLRDDAKWGAFHAAQAFVLPSHQENFGIVVAEALACATPVIISNQINIWQEVAQAGAGIIGDDTVDATETSLRKFLALPEDTCRDMGARGRELFLSRYEIERAVDSLLELIEDARAHRKGGR